MLFDKRLLLLVISFIIGATIYRSFERKAKPDIVQMNYWGSIKKASTKVQTTPDYSSNTKAVVNKMGVPIYVIECNKQWCQVKFVNDLVGWVNKSSISRKNTSMLKEKTYLYKDQNLKKKIADIYSFVVVENYKKVGEYCRVGKGKIIGWVRCKSLVGGHDSLIS